MCKVWEAANHSRTKKTQCCWGSGWKRGGRASQRLRLREDKYHVRGCTAIKGCQWEEDTDGASSSGVLVVNIIMLVPIRILAMHRHTCILFRG